MDSEELEHKKRELVFEAWKAIVAVQMHFNDMVMRLRNIATALIVAVFGAASLSLQRELYFDWGDRKIHVAFLIIVFGMIGWAAYGLMDWGFYHRLLIGAVKKSTEIEELHKGDPIFGMTGMITEESRIKVFPKSTFAFLRRLEIRARDKILFFYGLILFVGTVFAYVVYAHFRPTPGKVSPTELLF